METRIPANSTCTQASMRLCAEQRPVLIVFDLDGTIADSRELARLSYKRVFPLLGCGEITDEQADSFNGPDADEICRVMGIGPDKRPLYDQLLDESDAELVHSVGRVYPGVMEMLQALAPHAHLAILTNGSEHYLQTNIDVFGLAPYIGLRAGFTSGVSKAQRIAMWEKELSARRVICVGDRKSDVNNARAAGAIAVGVTYGMGSREELEGADYLCDTAKEVESVCRKLIALD